jgi:hypothetical protein
MCRVLPHHEQEDVTRLQERHAAQLQVDSRFNIQSYYGDSIIGVSSRATNMQCLHVQLQ